MSGCRRVRPDMSENFNDKIVQEFRANDGKVGGPFDGTPLLVLTTTGAKSGQPRTSPLVYQTDGERLLIFGSNGGGDTHPAWIHNLRAVPKAKVEVDTDAFDVVATELTGPERDRLYAELVAKIPGFGDYEKNTDRVIPVVALERV